MWRAILRNSVGGELDVVEGQTEDDLKERLRDRLHPVGNGWILSSGDTITFESRED